MANGKIQMVFHLPFALCHLPFQTALAPTRSGCPQSRASYEFDIMVFHLPFALCHLPFEIALIPTGSGCPQSTASYEFDIRHRVSTRQSTLCNPFSPRSGRRHLAHGDSRTSVNLSQSTPLKRWQRRPLAHGDSRSMRMSATDPFSPVGRHPARTSSRLGAIEGLP